MPAAAQSPFHSSAPEPCPASPPERVAAGPLVLRRVQAHDAGAIAVAVGASLDHLRPWMPWATPEAADLRSQLVRVAEADELWESGTGFIYVMIAKDTGPAGRHGQGSRDEVAGAAGHRGVPGHGVRGLAPGEAECSPGLTQPGAVMDPDGEFAGTIGLHRRPADDAVEIGYWTVAALTRRGYATAAARALTEVAVALPGTRRVEIHCDEANTASAGVPRKLGYRLDRVEAHEREAPGERGRRMIWVWDPAEGPRIASRGGAP